QAIEDTIIKKIPFDVKCRLITGKGNQRWVRSSGYPVIEDEKVARIIGMFLDITQEETDKEAFISEQNFSAQLIENMIHGFSVIDLDGRQIRVNKSFCDMTGFSKDELIGQLSPYPYWPPEEIPHILIAFQQILSGNIGTFELIFQKKNGERFPVLISAGLLKNEQGKPINYFANIKDISEEKAQEEELRSTKQKLESIFSEMNDVVWSMTYPDLETLFVTPSVETLYGYPHQEWVKSGSTIWQEIIYPEDKKIFEGIFELLEKEERVTLTYRIQNIQGAIKWVKNNLHLISDENGKPVRLDGIFSDLTQEKLTLQALEKQKSIMAKAEELANVGSWEWDIENDLWIMSKNWKKLHGVTDSDITSEQLLPIAHPDDRIAINEAISNSINNQVAYDIEHRIIRQDTGEIRSVYAQGMIISDSGDTPKFLIGVVQDITERKEAELALEKVQSILKQTNEVARVGGWEFNIETKEVTWTDTVRVIHETNSDFVPTFEDIKAFYTPESWVILEKAIECTITEGKPYNLELQIDTAKGKRIWVRAIGNGEFQNGICVRIYGTFQDIEKQKKIEEDLKREKEKAEIANQYKSEFLANMSHEIRTPLNAVIGFSDLLMQTQLSGNQMEYMQAINNSGNSLLSIINDVLDFSKIEAGKMELSIVKTDIRELVEQVMSIMRYKTNEKQIDLSLIVEKDVPKYISLDPFRVRQILTNLVSNAVKFTNKGRIDVHIQNVGMQNKLENHTLLFSVQDTGIGIEPEKINKIFDAFSQEDSSTTRNFGGTGLGLSICNKLLAMMKSHLNVESKLGEGSRFYFTLVLPIVKYRVYHTERSYAKPNFMHKMNIRRLPEEHKVLIVDDSQINRLLANRMLSSLIPKIEIFEAEDGYSAIEIFSKENPDLILMDIQMPRMSGYEATAKIRTLEQNSDKHIPIIAVTAGTIKGEKERCLDSGMDDYLSKPIELKTLESILEMWLSIGKTTGK
ncbi:MAG: PAS domain S-box protein, partial [Leptospira sp.]|nr:PAS domain S-box protein [Leptospira sp.]